MFHKKRLMMRNSDHFYNSDTVEILDLIWCNKMKHKAFIICTTFIRTIILFSGCVQSIEHCPPSYGISVTLLEGTNDAYRNVTSLELSAIPEITNLLDKVVENTSLSEENIFFEKNKWDNIIENLESIFLNTEETQYSPWIVYYRNTFFQINSIVIVC